MWHKRGRQDIADAPLSMSSSVLSAVDEPLVEIAATASTAQTAVSISPPILITAAPLRLSPADTLTTGVKPAAGIPPCAILFWAMGFPIFRPALFWGELTLNMASFQILVQGKGILKGIFWFQIANIS